MSLATYTDLLSAVASWMNRTDLTTIIPDFVTIAESKIARDLRLRNQITAGTLTTSTTTRAVALPTGWLEFESVGIDGTPDTQCTFRPNEYLDLVFPEGGASGRPIAYSIEGTNILFGPTPSSAYTVNISYYARFGALASNSTNWLLTNHPNIYLYACLREGAFFTKDQAGAQQWDGLYKQEVRGLQTVDEQQSHSGSTLAVRTA